jgi:outer membrane protein assembly factor BamB
MTRYVVVALILVAGQARSADWPQFLGPTRDGRSPEQGLLRSFPKKGPGVVWEKEVGEGYSAPVVFGEQLFLFHRVGDKDVIDCLDAATSKSRWSTSYPTEYSDRFGKGDGPRSTPLAADKHVYALAADGRLHCLDRADGKKVWTRALHEDYRVLPSFFGVGTSPILEGENVVVNVGGKMAGVVAFHKDTGKEVWKSLDDQASYSSPVAATLAGRRQLVFFTRTGLAILDPSDGKVRHQKRWRARINESVNAATPLVVGDEVFLSTSYDTGAVVLRVGKESLEEVWSGDEALSAHFSTPVLHDGHLYGFHGRQEQGTTFRCVEWKTGKVKWSKPGFGCGSLLLADGQLLVMSEGGELVLVEPTPAAYREKARAEVLSSPFRSHLVLANRRLYARDSKKLVCWDLSGAEK